jgi:hypothetical protein
MMKGCMRSSWSWSSSVNLSRGVVLVGGGGAEMRSAAIGLVKRIFLLSPDVSLRKRGLQTLGETTRRERTSSDAQTSAMFDGNAVEVLNFLRDQVATQELQVVQVIEHDAYWNYYHAASTAIAEAALEVRDAVAQRAEYQIYKDLIGFDGIHGVWESLKGSHAGWEDRDKARREAAERYLEAVNNDTYDEWRDRILERCRFAGTVSLQDLLGRLASPALRARRLMLSHAAGTTRLLVALA